MQTSWHQWSPLKVELEQPFQKNCLSQLIPWNFAPFELQHTFYWAKPALPSKQLFVKLWGMHTFWPQELLDMDILIEGRISKHPCIATEWPHLLTPIEIPFFYLCTYFPFFHKNFLNSPWKWDTVWVSAWICAPGLHFWDLKHLLPFIWACHFSVTSTHVPASLLKINLYPFDGNFSSCMKMQGMRFSCHITSFICSAILKT